MMCLIQASESLHFNPLILVNAIVKESLNTKIYSIDWNTTINLQMWE